MEIISLDPRVTRAHIQAEPGGPAAPKGELDQLETYEVFQQAKRGGHYAHVGSVHAPDAALAMVFARDQYARRGKCVGLWVTKTADIHVIGVEDADIFEPTLDKSYREAGGYKVAQRLSEFKKQREAENAK